MASYNEIDGLPAHANNWLINDVLRGEWGFRGLVVSDYFGIAELERKHHVVADLRGAGRKALETGVDVELPEPEGYVGLDQDMQSGRLTQLSLDNAVTRVLRAKFLLGLFEHPFVDVGAVPTETIEERALARRAAEEALVLLKNDKGLLPLDAKRIHSIAVIGPNAATVRLGGYSDVPPKPVSVLDGVRARLGAHAKVVYAPGCGLTQGNRGWVDDKVELTDPRDDARLIAQAAEVARGADVVLLVLGQNEQLSREAYADNHPGDRMSLDLPGQQPALLHAILATKRPVVTLLLNGSPIVNDELYREVPAILEGFYLGEEGGTAAASVLFGDVSPAGRLPVTIPRSIGALPDYYAKKPSASRPYLFEQPGPWFAFGHGLSYTTFRYESLSISPARIPSSGHATVRFKITNTGPYESDEVAQLYIRDVVSSVTRPMRELKGFRRVHLRPGETTEIEMSLGQAELAFTNVQMRRVVEPGDFDIMVGGSSASVQHAKLEVTAP